MYETLFKTDLKMLAVRQDWNTAYKNFIETISSYKVETEKDWITYLEIKEEFLKKVWNTFENED